MRRTVQRISRTQEAFENLADGMSSPEHVQISRKVPMISYLPCPHHQPTSYGSSPEDQLIASKILKISLSREQL
jgi:hypothetical protein